MSYQLTYTNLYLSSGDTLVIAHKFEEIRSNHLKEDGETIENTRNKFLSKPIFF